MTNNTESFVTEPMDAVNSVLPQRYEAFPDNSKLLEYDVKPCVTDLLNAQNSELLQRYETFPNKAKVLQYDVKPCVTEHLNGPYYELQGDVKPCVSDLLTGENSELPQRCDTVPYKTNEHQSDVKSSITDISLNSEQRQIHRYEECPNKRTVENCGVKKPVTDLVFMSNFESAPVHQIWPSPVPTHLVENRLCGSASSVTSSNQNTKVFEEDGDCIEGEGTQVLDVIEFDTLRPVSANLCQSNIAWFVSGEEDLENDIAGTPLSLSTQRTDHDGREGSQISRKDKTDKDESHRMAQERYKEKIFCDPDVLSAFRARDAKRKRREYRNWTPDQRERRKERWRENSKAYRQRKKERSGLNNPTATAIVKADKSGKRLNRQAGTKPRGKQQKHTEYMRMYRKNMSPQKRQALNAKRRQKYYHDKYRHQ